MIGIKLIKEIIQGIFDVNDTADGFYDVDMFLHDLRNEKQFIEAKKKDSEFPVNAQIAMLDAIRETNDFYDHFGGAGCVILFHEFSDWVNTHEN